MKDKIVNIVLSIILFIVPVVIIPSSLGKTYIPKIAILLICGLVLLVITLTRIDKLKIDKQDIAIFIFGIIAILSTIFSQNINKSIIGTSNRYEGLFSIITYILIYYNAKYYFKEYKNFANIASGIYILICIFAIVQFYAGNSIKLSPIFGKSSTGTFGNTNFMGSFISLVLPAFILGYLTKNKKIYLLGSTVGFGAMLMCHCRSSWLAFIAYMLLTILYIIISKNKKFVKRFIVIICIFIISFSIINVTDKSKVISRKINAAQNEVNKIVTTQKVTDNMGSGRIIIWKFTSKLIYKYPILGCGVDALEDGFLKGLTVDYMHYVIDNHLRLDKAHNEYLQIAATMGILAIGIYITFIGITLVQASKKMFKDELVTTLTIVIISYLIQAFFNISTIGVAPIFWFTIGMLSKNVNKEK